MCDIRVHILCPCTSQMGCQTYMQFRPHSGEYPDCPPYIETESEIYRNLEIVLPPARTISHNCTGAIQKFIIYTWYD